MYASTRSVQFGAGRPGLGDFTSQVDTASNIAQSGAATTAALLVTMGTVTGPVGALIGAAAAGITLLGSLIAKQFQGCGQTCVEATKIANQVGDYLTQNLKTYQAAPIHYASLRAAALNNFDTAAAAMQQACGNPALQAAGQRCISERLVKGGTAPWCPNPGHTGCDWITVLRDPIANDPDVVPDPSPVSQTVSQTLGAINALPISPWIIGLGLVGLGLALSGGRN